MEHKEEDDMPSADPAIRTDYEAALGQFILAFNEVDYRVSQVIRCELSKRGRADLVATACNGPFAQRLAALELLASSTTRDALSGLPIASLRSLNADRNNLAHGHFDQNPYDGSYSIVLAAKTRDYPIERVRSLSEELARLVEELRHTEILYDFEDLTDNSD